MICGGKQHSHSNDSSGSYRDAVHHPRHGHTFRTRLHCDAMLIPHSHFPNPPVLQCQAVPLHVSGTPPTRVSEPRRWYCSGPAGWSAACRWAVRRPGRCRLRWGRGRSIDLGAALLRSSGPACRVPSGSTTSRRPGRCRLRWVGSG